MKLGNYLAGAAALALTACSNSETTDTDGAAKVATEETTEPQAADAATATEAVSATPAEIEGITNTRLSFAPGTSSARIEAAITGYETVDYLLNVKQGQAMNISMASPNLAAYFNLLEPGETEVAVYNGSMSDSLNMFEGVAAKSGDYRIRVYLYRNAARRNETAPYTLEAIVN